MWHWFKESLQAHPELAIFLTLALGFAIGRLKVKSITLGSVTGTLLAGVLVGQLDIQIPDLVKTVAFIAFLFALGYRVAEWLMDTGGLCMFVGIVGIQSGPDFISGVKSEGLGLLFAGLVVTLLPMFLTLFLGKWLYKWPAATNLGSTAGTFTTTASIGAVCDTAKSRVPVLGYTVPYAIGNTLLTIWGAVIVALLS